MLKHCGNIIMLLFWPIMLHF